LTERARIDRIRLQTARGVSSVRFSRSEQGTAFGWMTQPIPLQHGYGSPSALLEALGVPRSTLPIELYDNGPHYVLVGVNSAAELSALRPNLGALQALGSIAAVVFAPLGLDWKCRVFAPGEGIAEDPATGAAAGALAVHLCRYGHLAFDSELRIEQGVEMGRPSLLHARVIGTRDGVSAVEVGGSVVSIGRGEIDLP
ncbi:MAG TPA: PhzF family phenazine biosynthesis protein, partial [Polyangiaceae bacterium]|nr:PhzF family phenazine biosynthesis protein [Polyangiaceae bacterium]